MKILGISSFKNNIMFGAIRREPTKTGYKVYDDDILTQEVSFSTQRNSLTKDTFDKSGHKIKSQTTRYPGKVVTNIDYKYNEYGNLVKRIMYNEQGEQLQISTYGYDAYNKISVFKSKDCGSGRSWLTLFDASGNKHVSVEEENNGGGYLKYVYNEDGTLSKEQMYDGKNKKNGRTVYKYGKNKNLTRCAHYDSKSQLVFEELYSPKTGKVLKALHIDEEGNTTEDEFLYDNKDIKLLLHTKKENGKEVSSKKYEYNAENELVMIIEIADEQIKSITKYNPETGSILGKTRFEKNNKISYDENYEYDDYGRVVSFSVFDGSRKEPDVYTFDYDKE